MNLLVVSNLIAQKGSNSLSLNAELILPIARNEFGFGSCLKGSYGIGNTGQLSFSAGFLKSSSNNTTENGKVNTRLIPFLFGYKQHIRRFFFEPKIGFGELGGKILINGDYARPSVGAVFIGLSGGYTIKRINLGVNFLNANGVESSSAGIWHNRQISYTSIYIGYNLFSGLKYSKVTN